MPLRRPKQQRAVESKTHVSASPPLLLLRVASPGKHRNETHRTSTNGLPERKPQKNNEVEHARGDTRFTPTRSCTYCSAVLAVPQRRELLLCCKYWTSVVQTLIVIISFHRRRLFCLTSRVCPVTIQTTRSHWGMGTNTHLGLSIVCPLQEAFTLYNTTSIARSRAVGRGWARGGHQGARSHQGGRAMKGVSPASTATARSQLDPGELGHGWSSRGESGRVGAAWPRLGPGNWGHRGVTWGESSWRPVISPWGLHPRNNLFILVIFVPQYPILIFSPKTTLHIRITTRAKKGATL